MNSFDIEHAGKKWSVAEPTPGAAKVLTRLVTGAASAEVMALKDAVGPAEFAEYKADFIRMVAAQEYKQGGRGWVVAVNGPWSNTFFLLSLLRTNHPDATVEDASALIAGKPDEVTVALAALVPGFFEMLAGLPETPPDQRKTFLESAANAKRQRTLSAA